MKTELKKINKLKRRLEIRVSEETLLKEKESIYKELSKSFKVPGFRPGTAPMSILEKHHGKVLREEFLKRAIPLYYSKALEENNLNPAGLPRISDVDFDDDKLSFTAEFEIKPEIDVEDKDYKGIKIRANRVEVQELEKEKVITQIKENIKKFAKKDLTDIEIAKWSGYDNIDSLKQALAAEILVNKLHARRTDIENFVAEELLKRVNIEAPKSVLDDHHSKLLDQEIYKLRMKGIKEQDLEKYTEDLKDKLKPLAEKQVKLYYILEKIAQKEFLEVTYNNIFEVVISYILSCAEYVE